MASTSMLLRAGISTAFRDGHRGGLNLSYDYTDYSFGAATAFGGRAPWSNVERYGFSLPLSYALQDGWSLGIAPSVDWKLSERWKLVNPLPAGPTGPAGLELDYRFDSDWNLGLGTAWRSTRFRLATNNAVANGIGEERGVPVFLRTSRNFGKQAALNLYAGVLTNGQLRLQDAAGNILRRVDYDTAPVIGATFTLRY